MATPGAVTAAFERLGSVAVAEQEIEPLFIRPLVDCPGGDAEPINSDASCCPTCGYTFTTVPDHPTRVPPHWKLKHVQ